MSRSRCKIPSGATGTRAEIQQRSGLKPVYPAMVFLKWVTSSKRISGIQSSTGETAPSPVGSPKGGDSCMWYERSILPTTHYPVSRSNPAVCQRSIPTLSYTYAGPGDFTAFIEACCRIFASRVGDKNEHINNPGLRYRLESVINAGSTNNSPVSALPPVVLCPIDTLCSFQVPVTDPNNDPVGFRLSTSTEATGSAGFDQPGPPDAPNAATIDATTGIYTWDTTGATRANNPANNTRYSTQVTIEDPTIKAALDFFVQLSPLDPTPPVITPPPGSPPLCGRTELFAIGNTKSFDVLASDPDATDTVTLNVAALPVGAIMTPSLPVTGNPLSSTFSWAPQANQSGKHVVTFTASSSAGGFTLCPVFVLVPPEKELVPARRNNVCRRSTCNIRFRCNLLEDLGACTHQVDLFVSRPSGSRRMVRFAFGVADVAPGETAFVRLKITKPGKKIARSGAKKLKGKTKIRNMFGPGIGRTPVRIKLK